MNRREARIIALRHAYARVHAALADEQDPDVYRELDRIAQRLFERAQVVAQPQPEKPTP